VLDHDVDAFFVCDLSDFFGNLLLVVVDAVVGAERAGFLEFGFVAGATRSRRRAGRWRLD
jgi:hypothetical protein